MPGGTQKTELSGPPADFNVPGPSERSSSRWGPGLKKRAQLVAFARYNKTCNTLVRFTLR